VYITQEFRVPTSIDTAWATLLRVEEVVQCMPGARITDKVDENTWKGTLDVSLGAIRLSFTGQVQLKQANVDTRTILFFAEGEDTKGKGNARGTVTSNLREVDGETVTQVSAYAEFSGPIAQFGRGLIEGVAANFVDQFATCLSARLQEDG
jgi:carbon monoxide dehydrogenase subunit G